jgi:hypothetical protein
MEQLILEGDADLRDEFEKFAQEFPEYASVEVEHGHDGYDYFALVIQNAPFLSPSIALLIAAIKGKAAKFSATRDGVAVDL